MLSGNKCNIPRICFSYDIDKLLYNSFFHLSYQIKKKKEAKTYNCQQIKFAHRVQNAVISHDYEYFGLS